MRNLISTLAIIIMVIAVISISIATYCIGAGVYGGFTGKLAFLVFVFTVLFIVCLIYSIVAYKKADDTFYKGYMMKRSAEAEYKKLEDSRKEVENSLAEAKKSAEAREKEFAKVFAEVRDSFKEEKETLLEDKNKLYYSMEEKLTEAKKENLFLLDLFNSLLEQATIEDINEFPAGKYWRDDKLTQDLKEILGKETSEKALAIAIYNYIGYKDENNKNIVFKPVQLCGDDHVKANKLFDLTQTYPGIEIFFEGAIPLPQIKGVYKEQVIAF